MEIERCMRSGESSIGRMRAQQQHYSERERKSEREDLGLNVAVNDTKLVEVGESITHLDGDAQLAAQWDRLVVLVEVVKEIRARNVLLYTRMVNRSVVRVLPAQ